jgi:drug/metabolite transporter (DMT)-like permease
VLSDFRGPAGAPRLAGHPQELAAPARLRRTVGFTAFNAFLYSALQFTSAINAVIEQAGIPMVIFVQ